MEQHRSAMKMGWGRFALMIATSSAIMFLLMYQLVYRADDALFSLNRFLAALIGGCVMAIVMLAFMWSMYEDRRRKVAVLAVAAVAAVALLYANRSQGFVDDTTFMRAMIPHHSIAINNARKAEISDPRVRRLADQIIASQVREIAEMRLLIDDIDKNGRRATEPLPPRPATVTPDMLPKISEAIQ